MMSTSELVAIGAANRTRTTQQTVIPATMAQHSSTYEHKRI
jgi:hypothetical protein